METGETLSGMRGGPGRCLRRYSNALQLQLRLSLTLVKEVSFVIIFMPETAYYFFPLTMYSLRRYRVEASEQVIL